ncbi:MAG: F0F1 ATP synthase subunit B [Ktedonobacteraceae bacterium]
MIFSSMLVQAAGNTGLLGGLGVNLWSFISQLVSFSIVVAVLGYFGFPVIQRILEQRRTLIQKGVENAAQAKRDLVEATANAEEILRRARIPGQEAFAQATKAAEAEAQRIYEEAQTRAAQVEQQQVARIQQEAARARAELSRLVVNLSIGAAGKVISKSVDTNDNRRMVEEFVAANETTRQ